MTRLFMLLAMLVGGLAATPALASKVTDAAGEMTVTDEAGLFTADGIKKAKDAFLETTFHGRVKFAVHTYKTIPDSKKAEFDAAKGNENTRGQFFSAWAKDVAKQSGNPQLFMLVYKTDKAYFVRLITDRETEVGRGLSQDKENQIAGVMVTALRGAHEQHLTGEPLHAKLDGALQDATTLVIESLRNTSVAGANHVNTAHGGGGGGNGIMGYVCLGLCVLLGVWLVVGLIRAFTGGGGGGMGGGGYGGGGGGFMSSMLGGLFGGMAGMWMYNHFFGGGMSGLGASDSYGADGGGNMDTGAGDYDGGGSAGDGGGDWGGGDAGGGGDWGGGDFGGGDFGGGGGDW